MLNEFILEDYLLRYDIVQTGKYVPTFKNNLPPPSLSTPTTETADSSETSMNTGLYDL
jgi:hypothetical protein